MLQINGEIESDATRVTQRIIMDKMSLISEARNIEENLRAQSNFDMIY